jgi:hypothetical protein
MVYDRKSVTSERRLSMRNIFKRTVVTSIIMIMAASVMSGCDSNKETKNQSKETKQEITDQAFVDGKKDFDEYLSGKYNKKTKKEAENIYSYTIRDKEKNILVKYAFVYLKSTEEADKYIDNVSNAFSEEFVSEYDAGDKGITIIPSEDIDYPSYILAKKGTGVYTVSYEDEYEADAKEFIAEVTK